MKIIQPFQYLIATTTINNIDTSSLNKFVKKYLTKNLLLLQVIQEGIKVLIY